jgi:hypothetical protein
MTVDELKESLAQLLSEEEVSPVDWERVQDLCIDILVRLRAAESLAFPAQLVIPYLTEFELRRADAAEAQRQQVRLTAYLRQD